MSSDVCEVWKMKSASWSLKSSEEISSSKFKEVILFARIGFLATNLWMMNPLKSEVSKLKSEFWNLKASEETKSSKCKKSYFWLELVSSVQDTLANFQQVTQLSQGGSLATMYEPRCADASQRILVYKCKPRMAGSWQPLLDLENYGFRRSITFSALAWALKYD